jgi:hypothetical protein
LQERGQPCSIQCDGSNDAANRRENITDWAFQQFGTHYGDDTISKWDIFYYVYGLLHHPGYRTKFADNLKRELPRIPFAPPVGPACRAEPGTTGDAKVPPGRRDLPAASGFWAFAAAGK